MEPGELTPTAKVLLGMLRLGKRTGYEIKQLVDVSTRFFWAASYGQIYPELKRLEERGLVVGKHQPTGGRARTEYRLTTKGERVLDEWLADDAEPALESRDEALLKLFFSEGRDTKEALQTIRALRARHERILASLREIEPAAPAEPEPGPFLTLRYGLGMHEWAVGWLQEAEERLMRGGSKRRARVAGRA